MFKLQYSNKSNDDPTRVNVNYYSTMCKNIQQKIDNTGHSYISSQYSGRMNQPNIKYIEPGNTPIYYKSSNIFVCGNIHTISNLDYDGEIIIEHISTVSNNTKLYTCFLMKHNGVAFSEKVSGLDKLINAVSVYSYDSNAKTSNISIAMNDYIDFDTDIHKAICYDAVSREGVNCKILIFMDVIQTSVDISEFSTTGPSIFSVTPTNTPIVVTIGGIDELPIREGFGMKTLDGGEKVLTSDGPSGDIFSCEYLPVSTDTAQVFQIPIGTDMVATKSNEDAISIILYFIVSVFIVSIVFFASPVFYHLEMFSPFRKEIPDNIIWISEALYMKRTMTWVDVIFSATLIILAFSLIVAGFSTKSNSTKIMGFFFLFLFVIGGAGIFVDTKLKKGSDALKTIDDAKKSMEDEAPKLTTQSS